jgi:hypothetical protein
MMGPAAPGSRPTVRRSVVLTLLLVASVIAVAAAHEGSIGRTETAAADAAAANSDWFEAIAHARAAAEAVVPGSPWPARGLRRLEAIGHDAEARGDVETALVAYGAMRTASLATRSAWTTRGDWRLRAEEGLARAATARPEITGPRVSAQSMLDALEQGEPPPGGALTALSASAIATVAGLVWLAAFGGPGGRKTPL